jgi:hypothetical protein
MSRSIIFTVAAFGLLSTFAGCRDFDVTQRAQEISQFRKNALLELPHVPYRQKQHEAFQVYFSAVVNEGVSIIEEGWRLDLLKAWIEDSSIGSLCAQVLLKKSDFTEWERRCWKNRFYICADEVKGYAEVWAQIWKRIGSDAQEKLKRTPECAARLL